MQQEITYASNVSLFMAEIIRRLVNGYAGDQILNDLKDARHHFEKLAMLFEPPAESPNEQPVEQISDDVHEKEVMMQAFDNVRQIFERRNWIMEGRGSYPYNDDQYKEEVRYMYDEFDKLFKETWGNIKSKSYDYRQAIIAEYMKGEQKENDAVLFGEWIRFNKFRPFTEGRWIKFESGEILGTTKQLYNEYKRQSMISEMK